MTRFFDSEQVKESLLELDRLQNKICDQIFQVPFFSSEKKREHLEMMKEFLEKQKVFIFRLSLSDDPEAIQLKRRILESAKMFGLNSGDDINVFFEKMEESLKQLEKTLDD